MYDAIIIGAGVVGCGIARELSRFQLKIGVLEKEADVGWGASCRNSGVVHSGYNNKPGSFMARFCVEGNRSFEQLCRELDVPFSRIGKLVVADTPEEIRALERLKAQGEANGVEGIEIIDGDEVRHLEPHLENAHAAMLSPNSAITSPYHLTIALAENSLANGVDFFLNSEVEKISFPGPETTFGSGPDTTSGSGSASGSDTTSASASNSGLGNASASASNSGSGFKNGYTVTAGGRNFRCRVLINSAGVQAARISGLAGIEGYRIYPCRGEYHVLDKYAGELIDHLVYPVPKPGAGGLGIHLTPTVEGNILIGPSNEYTDEAEDYRVTAPVMKTLSAEAGEYMHEMNGSCHIRSYAGMRAKQTPPEVGGYYDYIIKEEEASPGFINLIGIESPGLTASQPISKYVTEIVKSVFERQGRKVREDLSFVPVRKAPIRFAEQDDETRAALIAEDPEYGEVICRCETVTRREVLQAIENPLGARSLISIKYRSRAMMGRCQGGYCTQRILQILRDEYGYRPEEICLGKPGSRILTGRRNDRV